MIALKACPFCGGEARLINPGLPRVMCWTCNGQTGAAETKAEVAEAWNARTPPPVSLDEVADLKHDLDRARATANELAEENERLIEALGQIAALNDLSAAPDDEVEAWARSNLYACERIAREALR